jgi:hypothetical protein
MCIKICFFLVVLGAFAFPQSDVRAAGHGTAAAHGSDSKTGPVSWPGHGTFPDHGRFRNPSYGYGGTGFGNGSGYGLGGWGYSPFLYGYQTESVPYFSVFPPVYYGFDGQGPIVKTSSSPDVDRAAQPALPSGANNGQPQPLRIANPFYHPELMPKSEKTPAPPAPAASKPDNRTFNPD